MSLNAEAPLIGTVRPWRLHLLRRSRSLTETELAYHNPAYIHVITPTEITCSEGTGQFPMSIPGRRLRPAPMTYDGLQRTSIDP